MLLLITTLMKPKRRSLISWVWIGLLCIPWCHLAMGLWTVQKWFDFYVLGRKTDNQHGVKKGTRPRSRLATLYSGWSLQPRWSRCRSSFITNPLTFPRTSSSRSHWKDTTATCYWSCAAPIKVVLNSSPSLRDGASCREKIDGRYSNGQFSKTMLF